MTKIFSFLFAGGLQFFVVGIIIFAVVRAIKNKTGPRSKTPWMSRKEWQTPTIKLKGVLGGLIFFIIFATFWNGFLIVFVSAMILNPPKGDQPLWMLALFMIPFFAVGIGLAAFIIYTLAKARKFKGTTFQMDSHPGIDDQGHLTGTITIPKVLKSDDGRAAVSIKCQHVYTTGSGKHRSTHRDTLWESEAEIPMTAGFGMTTIPVDFAIDNTMPDSSTPQDSRRIEWMLGAKCDLPGVDLDLDLHIPMFRKVEGMNQVVVLNVAPVAADPGDSGETVALESEVIAETVDTPGIVGSERESIPMKTNSVGGLIFFALIWNGFIGGIAGVMWKQEGMIHPILWLFIAVGMLILFLIPYTIIHNRKFRNTKFITETSPGVDEFQILRGKVVSDAILKGEPEPCTITLTCKSGSGKQQNNNNRSLEFWQGKIKPRPIITDRGVEIPVEIPVDANTPDTSPTTHWELRVVTNQPGVDLQAIFIVPIKRK